MQEKQTYFETFKCNSWQKTAAWIREQHRKQQNQQVTWDLLQIRAHFFQERMCRQTQQTSENLTLKSCVSLELCTVGWKGAAALIISLPSAVYHRLPCSTCLRSVEHIVRSGPKCNGSTHRWAPTSFKTVILSLSPHPSFLSVLTLAFFFYLCLCLSRTVSDSSKWRRCLMTFWLRHKSGRTSEKSDILLSLRC